MSNTKVKRAFKFRFYPTPEQEKELLRTWGCVRLVYNKALDMRHTAWYKNHERVNYSQTSAALTQWKKQDEFSFLKEVSSVPLQQCLRHLQSAFANFFEKRMGYPKFKSRKKSRLGLEYSKSGFKFKGDNLHIARLKEPLAAHWSRDFDRDSVSTVTITKDKADRWFVSCLGEVVVEKRRITGKTVGLDMGAKDTLVLSTGQKLSPRDDRDMKKKLAKVNKYQRRLSKKKIGSKNFAKAKTKLSKAHVQVVDARKDWIHKTTTQLVKEFDVVCIEDLNVRGMTTSTRDKGRKAKAGLNRRVLEQSFAEIRHCLEYKAKDSGGEVVAIDRFFPSSKTCSSCGYINDLLTLNQRFWTCPRCSTHLDRDINAAKNIQAAGLAVIACGDGVRPAKKPVALQAGTRQ
ncbi:transposase [Corynebacterium sp. ACRPE]|uniref:RNA-guided endonuclease InsQ/TnpB family protein n=1 Tax=Corynebacterium sp. ACRPE TaxID=2918196 RepID=UPI001EF673ED|nr:transposase [Corynebacterium sp. ACRPE]MCG7467211.1 transposase [Corynebacterium sp. ACRPE]